MATDSKLTAGCSSFAPVPPPTKREARMFAILLAQCRKQDILRRTREGRDVMKDPKVKVIAAFC